MARQQVEGGALRECPTCATPVSEAVNLGLRDFSWVNSHLPGKLGFMDVDGMLHQAQTGRILVLELKPRGARISRGARLTFDHLVSIGFDVWYVWDLGAGLVDVSPATPGGWVTPERLTRDELADDIAGWWEEGL